MKVSDKVGIALIAGSLLFLGARLIAKQQKDEARQDTAAQQAQAPELPFPGTGNRVDWEQALTIAKRAGQELEAREFDKALELDKQAIAKYPYDSHFYKQMGIVYVRRGHQGDLQMGEDLFKRAISLKSDDSQYWSLLATILTEEHKLPEAREALVKASQCNPTPQAAAEIDQNIQKLDAALQRQGH
jgi:tetratricopeptide (TPR) repeat protein